MLALILIAFSAAVYTLLSRSLHERVNEGLRSVIGVATVSLTHDAEEGQTSEGRREAQPRNSIARNR
jgi:hypothetical protein